MKNRLLLSILGLFALSSSALSYQSIIELDNEPALSKASMPEPPYGAIIDCNLETLVCNRELLEEYMALISVVADDQDRYHSLQNDYCMTSQEEITCKPNERIAAYTGEAYYANKISGGQCLFRMNGKSSIPFYRVCQTKEEADAPIR
ncbi:MAG: hypothetical protein K0U41_07395 [Gammaproteobacteria bacterium]|nr:hypothetical protein [Gammaproteobacteria bacterium]